MVVDQMEQKKQYTVSILEYQYYFMVVILTDKIIKEIRNG